MIGGAAFTLSMYAADQTMVQRYLSLKTTAKAQMLVNIYFKIAIARKLCVNSINAETINLIIIVVKHIAM